MPDRASWERMKDYYSREDCYSEFGITNGANLTAIMGFSVANFESFAHSSLRFSGGKKRSRRL